MLRLAITIALTALVACNAKKEQTGETPSNAPASENVSQKDEVPAAKTVSESEKDFAKMVSDRDKKMTELNQLLDERAEKQALLDKEDKKGKGPEGLTLVDAKALEAQIADIEKKIMDLAADLMDLATAAQDLAADLQAKLGAAGVDAAEIEKLATDLADQAMKLAMDLQAEIEKIAADLGFDPSALGLPVDPGATIDDVKKKADDAGVTLPPI